MADEEREIPQSQNLDEEKKAESTESEPSTEKIEEKDTIEEREEKKGKKKRRKRVKEVEILEKELKEKAKSAEEYYDKFLRAKAELDNYKKRKEKERLEFMKYATEGLISEIIPVIDNFERAFAAAEKVPETKNFALGVELILKQMKDLLARNGVEEDYPIDQQFDPFKHEAAEKVETEEHPDGKIIEVIQRGYTLNGKLVQPALVKVAVSPRKEEETVAAEGAEDTEDEEIDETEAAKNSEEMKEDEQEDVSQ